MSARTFLGWQAYYSIEPWGEERGDMRSAQICAVIANTAPRGKKNRKRFTIRDFMLFREPISKQETWKKISGFFMEMMGKSKPLQDDGGEAIDK